MKCKKIPTVKTPVFSLYKHPPCHVLPLAITPPPPPLLKSCDTTCYITLRHTIVFHCYTLRSRSLALPTMDKENVTPATRSSRREGTSRKPGLRCVEPSLCLPGPQMYIHTHIYIFIYVCVCVYLPYVFTYIHTYIYIYIYI
jgi:hypothetical protein